MPSVPCNSYHIVTSGCNHARSLRYPPRKSKRTIVYDHLWDHHVTPIALSARFLTFASRLAAQPTILSRLGLNT